MQADTENSLAGSRGEARTGEEEVQSAAEGPSSRSKREDKVRQNVSSMMFVELLFWKNQRESEDVRDEYNWQVSPVIFLHCTAKDPKMGLDMQRAPDFREAAFWQESALFVDLRFASGKMLRLHS